MGRTHEINEKGNAVFAALLFVVIVGMIVGTGWFVWHAQKDTNNTLDKTTKTNSSSIAASSTGPATAKPKMLTATMDPSIGKSISFMYPATWKLVQGVLQKSPYIDQKFTLTSPSGQISVVYETSDGGLGGACIPSEQGVLTTFTATDVSSFLSAKYVETTFTNGMMGGLVAFAGLMNSSQLDGATTAAKGSSYCDIYLADIIPLYENSDSSAHISAGIDFLDSSVKKDATKFNAALSETEYVQAKAILTSTVVK